MIQELHVKNFALIEEARIEFGEGFNVLTGETGAGKSLLIDALLIVAGKGSADFIRSGATEATVEAIFEAKEDLRATFEEIGNDDFISLRKVLSRSGKTKQYINGNFVSQVRIKELLSRLLHVYGQNETKDLYDESYQRELYDLFCDNRALLKTLRDTIIEARQKRKTLDELKEKEMARAKELDYIAYQINEIRQANLVDDNEEEVLTEVRTRLLARERIIKNLGTVYEILYGGDKNVFDALSQANKLIVDLNLGERFIDETMEELKGVAEAIRSRAISIKGYLEELEGSEEDLNRIEERLDTIYKLKKKYGSSIKEIKDYLKELEVRYDELKNVEESIEKIEKELQSLRKRVIDLAEELSQKRKESAKDFSLRVQKELSELGMPKALFSINFIENDFNNPEEMPLTGKEGVQFLFSSHSGEDARPLSKIASGGELSRVMLAVKNVIPKERAMTVIFDEVDTGVGGKTAESLGKKLREIAKRHQVICITHLPQVAVFGEHHFKVEKVERNGKLHIQIKRLDESERLAEITRMLGGDLTSKGRDYAEEMLKKARLSEVRR